MAWIHDSSEPGERQPIDVVYLVVGAVGVVVLGVWGQSQTSVDLDLFRVLNSLPNALRGPARIGYALGSIWAVVGIALVLLALRRWRIACHVALAGFGAWAGALALHHVLGSHAVSNLDIHLRAGGEPVYASSHLAVITAVVVALGPSLVRPVRRLLVVVIVMVGLAAMYLGAALPSDAIGGLLLGLAAGSAVLVFGASSGRPSLDEVREALVGLGIDLADVHRSDERVPRLAIMDVTLKSGERQRVVAYGRDQRDGQIAAKVWHTLMYREPALPVFGTRLQQVEHVAYTLMLAERGGVAAPRTIRTGMAGPDAALLLTTEPTGVPLDSVPADRQGIRSSIVDRMARHDGSAEIRSHPGAGTEVRLRMPRTPSRQETSS